MFSMHEEKPAPESKQLEKKEGPKTIELTQRTLLKDHRVHAVHALSEDRLLLHIAPEKGDNYIAIFDIASQTTIKKVFISSLYSCEPISDNTIACHTLSGILIYDFNLDFHENLGENNRQILFALNDDIMLGYHRHHRYVNIYASKSLYSENIRRLVSEFTKAVGYDNIGSLIHLGKNKFAAVYDDRWLRIIEWKDEKYTRIGEFIFQDLVHSVTRINEHQFIVGRSTSKGNHLYIYDANTLKCIDEITLPKKIDINKINMMPDGKTLICWHSPSRNAFCEVDLESHQYNTFELPEPERIDNLTILPNGKLCIFSLFSKEVIEFDFAKIKMLRTQGMAQIKRDLQDTAKLSRDVTGVVASYLPEESLPLLKTESLPPANQNLQKEKEILKQKITTTIENICQWHQFLGFFSSRANHKSILKLCLTQIDSKLSDEDRFTNELTKLNYISKICEEDSICEIVRETYRVIQRKAQIDKLGELSLELKYRC